jgi:hypothetical protein
MRFREDTGARDQKGKKSRFPATAVDAGLSPPVPARHTAPRIANNKPASAGTNGEEVKLISYLPAAITTLFTLAASLLLGYLQ